MKKILLVIVLIFNILSSDAQSLSDAKSWYLKGFYEKAMPVFQKQLKNRPKDPGLNLWYGVCLMKTGKEKIALPYLEFAKNRNLQNAYFHLAEYYLKAGLPDSSITLLDKYLSYKDLGENQRITAVSLKDSAVSSLEKMQRVEDVCFIDSVIVPRKNIYEFVKLSKEAGSLVRTESLFKESKYKLGYAFFPERNDRVYYADTMPGKDLDIVARHRLLNDWDKPEILPDPINSLGNEKNPFFLQDGTTLYFASDRKGGMGGYDIYVSRLNISNNTYLLPDLLNRPFNSPYNEYFLIIDETANRGYLATDRNSGKNFVTIYTFIPQKVRTLVKNKNLKELNDLAMIRSIKATWEGKNIDSLKKSINIPPVIQIDTATSEHGFDFRINDEIVYHNIEEFNSPEARKAFLKYLKLSETIKIQKTSLNALRESYNNLAEDKKTQAASEILKLEAELLKNQKELPVLEINSRNLEIKAISK
jgi:hypothetical protein